MEQRSKNGRVDEESPCEHGVTIYASKECKDCAAGVPANHLLEDSVTVVKDPNNE